MHIGRSGSLRSKVYQAASIAMLVGILISVIGQLAEAFTPVFNSVPGTTSAVVLTGTLSSDRYDPWQYSYRLYRFAGEAPDASLEEAKLMLFEAPDGTWHDLRLGLTEYGEFIVANDTIRAGLALGPNFGQTESLAGYPNLANVFSGWVLYLNYTRVGGPAGQNREILAWAVSGNFLNPGEGRGVLGKWTNLLWSSSLVTEGLLVPNGVKILYESARLVIARVNISIFDDIDLTGDGRPDATDYVADVVFTVVFNKVMKYAIVYKDVIIRLDRQLVERIDAIYFGNREKLDIAAAINNNYDSYVHYYHNFSETVYQYPILDWNKTDILVAYNDGDPDNSRNVTDPQFVVFKFFWPNATEFSVYAPDEIVPRPSGFSPGDPRDGLLSPGTMVPDLPSEPGIPYVVVQWRFTRSACDPGDIVCQRINALLDSLLDSTVTVPGTSENVPVTRQVRFVEVLGMTTRSANTTSINPDIPINWDDGARAWDINLILMKGTWDAQDNNRYPDTIAGRGHGGYTGGGVNSPGLEVLFFWSQVFMPDDLNMVDQHTFKIIAVGFNAPPEDTAGSAALSGPHFFPISQPIPMLDKFNLVSRRSIPYILQSTIDGMVNDTSPDGFYRVIGPVGFVFADRGQPYDDVTNRPAEPVAGGFSANFTVNVPFIILNETVYFNCRYFYPSINQLFERVAWCDLVGRSTGTIYEQKVFQYPVTNYTATGIISVAGPKANAVSRYFNDFSFAILREGSDPYALITGGAVIGAAPTSDPARPSLDIFPVSTWNISKDTGYRPTDTSGYFVVYVARDVNGTLGYVVWGWDARDSFWGSVWASYYLGHFGGWLPPGTVALIVRITYTSDFKEAASFTIVEALGTIMNFKLSYEAAFGKFAGIPSLPPSPPLVDLDTLIAVNSGTYNPLAVGISSYIGSYISTGGDQYTKTLLGFPWWGEKLPTYDGTGLMGVFGPARR